MYEDGDLIFRSDGQPFKDEKAARIQGKRILNNEKMKTKPVAVDGGWALKKLHQKRPKRTPMNKRNVLRFKQVPGYHLRVFNDKPEDQGQRIEDAKNAGWEPVISDNELGDNYAGRASKMGSAVTKPVGSGMTGVLMKKKQEWFDEDEQAKQDLIDAKEQELVAAKAVGGKYGKIEVGNLKSSY